MNKLHLEKLQNAYKENKLIPFIGSGLSIPFKIPDWGNLILSIGEKCLDSNLVIGAEKLIERQKYWEAIKYIKDLSDVSEFAIQEEIRKIVSVKMQTTVSDENHNYIDLVNMNFKNYLTTNYDLLISKYINNPLSVPQVLYKAEVNSQTFFQDNQAPSIWHLHGHISDVGSIVISEEKYNELYTNDKYKNLFGLFQGNGVLLFIGFSLADQYVQDILNRNKKFFNSEHYMLLDRPDSETKQKFIKEYNVNVIEYNSENGGHASEIRRILNMIKLECEDVSEELEIPPSHSNEELQDIGVEDDDVVITVPTNTDRSNLEKSLFCRKIRLEEIHEDTLEYSQDCFFMADAATRILRKKGYSERVIQEILAISYMQYKKIKTESYRVTADSQSLIDTVHRVLEEYDFSKLVNNKNNEVNLYNFQKAGFIHILADDVNKDVWWGRRKL